MAIGGKIPNFQEGIHLQYIHRPFRTHHVSLEGNWKISPNVLEIDQLLNDYTSLSAPKKKSTVILFFWVNRVIYHHVTIITLGISNFNSPKKKHTKNTNPEFPCALQPKLLNLKWTRSAAEILLHAGLDISQVVASYQNSQKKGGSRLREVFAKKMQNGKCWNRGEVLRASNKFFQNREDVMVGSQLLNNLSGSGIPADHPNGTTEPRKKKKLLHTFHWILAG